jgi:hypothetical protein
MDRSERIRRRDRSVSTVRRITLWVSAGSLALAAGVGALLGLGQAGSADTRSSTTPAAGTPTTGATDAPSTTTDPGFQQPWQPPGSSGGSGRVTSGGS